jgi:hypothetical protein
VNKLEQLFHNAGNASIPNYRKTVTIKSKGNGIWNREISSASSKSKEAVTFSPIRSFDYYVFVSLFLFAVPDMSAMTSV